MPYNSPLPNPASDFDAVLNSFRRLNLGSASPDPSPSGRETLYRVDTLTQVQYTNHWQVSDEAAHLSQGVSDARSNSSRSAEARIQVDGARGNIHQSYPSEDTAHAAFQYAQERGWPRTHPDPVFARARVPSSTPPNPLHTGPMAPRPRVDVGSFVPSAHPIFF
ncbi:hypothetical protein C8R47DRAFT_1216099 [Mycena vitilis]|nr:hypothetical protein C8R47DRAFT_1216099 [Mycena vitilis]